MYVFLPLAQVHGCIYKHKDICINEYINIHLMKEVKAPPLKRGIEGLETIGQGSRDGNKPLHHFFLTQAPHVSSCTVT